MMGARKADWQSSFWRCIEREASAPFVWGERDCVMFAARVADSVVTTPYYEALARQSFRWESARDAIAVLRGTDLGTLVKAALGDHVPWPKLQMGDIVLLRHADAEKVFDSILGVHDGVSPIAPADRKLIHLDWSQAVCGWRI